MLNRESLLGLQQTVVAVPVPDTQDPTTGEPERVYVRSLTLAERERFVTTVKHDRQNAAARLAVLVLCEEDGTPMFKPDEWKLLNGLPSKVLDVVVQASNRLSTMSEDEAEEFRKNFKSQS